MLLLEATQKLQCIVEAVGIKYYNESITFLAVLAIVDRLLLVLLVSIERLAQPLLRRNTELLI